MKTRAFIIVVAVLLFVLYQCVYIVDETDQVVLTQFGKVIGEPVTEPGLKFKIPFIQKPNYFAKILLDQNVLLGKLQNLPQLDRYLKFFQELLLLVESFSLN